MQFLKLTLIALSDQKNNIRSVTIFDFTLHKEVLDHHHDRLFVASYFTSAKLYGNPFDLSASDQRSQLWDA